MPQVAPRSTAAFALGFSTALFCVGLGGLGLMAAGFFPEAAPPVVVVAAPPAAAPAELPVLETAELMLNTNPATRVFVDGVDTGRRTPIPPAQPLRLMPGARNFMFETDAGQRHFATVVLRAGGNRVLFLNLGAAPLRPEACRAADEAVLAGP